MKKLLIAAAFVALSATSALSASVSNKTTHIEFSGEINGGDFRKLQSLIDATGIKVVHFNSPGGNAIEGFNIGTILKRNNMKGVITKGSICMSACAWAFLGTEDKIIDGVLGFHTAYVASPSGGPAKAGEFKETPTATLKGGQFIGATNAAYFFDLGYRFQLQSLIQYTTDPQTYLIFQDETDLDRFKYEKAEDYTYVEKLPPGYIADRIAGPTRLYMLRNNY